MSDIDTEADRLSARLSDRVNQRRKDHARSRMIDVAESLHASLSTMNELGDVIDGRIATQTDGCPYGEVRDGLEALCAIIWGDDGPLILADTYACGSTLRQSAMFFAKRDAERREDRANARWIIESASENACWSNDAGWVPVEQATVFTTAEMEQFNLPLVTDNEVCWTRLDEPNGACILTDENLATEDDCTTHDHEPAP